MWPFFSCSPYVQCYSFPGSIRADAEEHIDLTKNTLALPIHFPIIIGLREVRWTFVGVNIDFKLDVFIRNAIFATL